MKNEFTTGSQLGDTIHLSQQVSACKHRRKYLGLRVHLRFEERSYSLSIPAGFGTGWGKNKLKSQPVSRVAIPPIMQYQNKVTGVYKDT